MRAGRNDCSAVERDSRESGSFNIRAAMKAESQRKILIIDDDMVSLTMLRELVDKIAVCKAHEFAHPILALAWCKRNEPALIVVDHLMPGAIDGIEFTRRLRELPNRATTPVL